MVARLTDSGVEENLLFARTVDRTLVHRAAVSEVLLTDWRPIDATTFVLAAQWPRGHALHTPIAGRWHDPTLAAETIRQAGLLIAHSALGVPGDTQFLMRDLSYNVDPEGLGAVESPADLLVRLTCHEIHRRGGALSSMRVRVTLVRDGWPVGTGTGSFRCLAPEVYDRLRGNRRLLPAPAFAPQQLPVPPSTVGRERVRDIVLAPAPPIADEHTWELRADREHPVLFDHAVDHVPGMVLIEAMRQAACLVTGWPVLIPVGLDSRFLKYTELDEPCRVEASKAYPTGSGRARVAVSITQSKTLVAEGSLDVRRATSLWGTGELRDAQ